MRDKTGIETETNEKLLTPPEVAQWLRVTVQTLANWRAGSKAPARGPRFVKVGRCVRYRRVDVVEYIQTGGSL